MIYKAAVLLIASLLLLSPPKSKAQTSEKKDSSVAPHKNILSLFPLAFINSNLMVGYERAVTNKVGLRVIGAYGIADYSETHDLSNYQSQHLEGQVKYYPLGKAPSGFFVGAYLLYKHISFDLDDYTVYDTSQGSAQSTAFGVLIGWQLIASRTVAFDMFIGGGPNLPSGDYQYVSGNAIDSYKKGMVFKVGFAFGIAF